MARGASVVMLMIASLLAGACADLDWMSREDEPPPPPGTGLNAYLEPLADLSAGDPGLQADVYQRAERAYDAAPTTGNRLLYALVLATPGHPYSDAAQARSLLVQLLAEPEAMLPEERDLARISLNIVQQRLELEAAKAQAEQTLGAQLGREQAARARQNSALQAEIDRLTDELNSAQDKLDAIANIERSIERTPGTQNGPQPDQTGQ